MSGIADNPTTDPLLEKKNVEELDEQIYHAELSAIPTVEPPSRQFGVNWRLIIWSLLGTVAVLMMGSYGQSLFFATGEPPPIAEGGSSFVPPLTPTPSVTPSATPTIEIDSDFTILEPTETPTAAPGGQLSALRSEIAGSGWVISDEIGTDSASSSSNHFGDSFLYAGVLDGKIYHAAFQFDLSSVPPGTKINGASLRLTSLRTDLLAKDANAAWTVHVLTPDINADWQNIGYDQLRMADVWSTLRPIPQSELGDGQVNDIELSSDLVALLERSIGAGEKQLEIAFRIDGPQEGADNLYAWDSGSGLGSRGAGPELFLNFVAPTATPNPDGLVIVTSTPTPEHILTAVANSMTATAEATRIGTATPVPEFWATPIFASPTSTAENEATVQVLSELATAVAFTTGEPSSDGIILATDTPTPVYTPTPILPATPTPTFDPRYLPTYVIITSTPTPESVMTAAASSLSLTAEALQFGTATPLPFNWVTPVVVTSTPIPENAATSQFLQAVALTTGTPVSLPNVQTATPTPVLIPVNLVAATAPIPSATPRSIPATLLGKILFRSDRIIEDKTSSDSRSSSPEKEPQILVFDPATNQLLGRLTALWPYDVALAREAWSVDDRFRVFTKDAIRHPLSAEGKTEMVPALYVYDYLYQIEWQLTKFGAGIAYDGVWSPTREQIAFLSTDSADDEVWVVDYDGANIKQLTASNEAYNAREIGKDTFIPEVSRRPSWSPDGEQIVFYSNRSGNYQLWIMNRDGGDQRLLMDWNPYNDWDPIWVKTLDPAPLLVR